MELLTIDQASQELGITHQGLRYLIKSGYVDPKKIVIVNKPTVRIYSSEVERLKIKPRKRLKPVDSVKAK